MKTDFHNRSSTHLHRCNALGLQCLDHIRSIRGVGSNVKLGGGHFNIRAPFSLKKGIFPLFYLEKRALWEKVEGAHAPNAPGSYAYEEYSDP